ncbi:putative transcriptional regulator, MerR family [Caenispirillum salinarum AK4]|uniref:Putative transcriptional regulator, MerR family n=1 Tax=Caenispirillum salinarum AK4 TaxID=1238182 RepID=K9HVE1_9PROT|nr:helix-turn-helix domain-containing protein [Caenispirillum salinarum]EKV32186.1 putative transcriptional regulator, MerR family [Caenispirillum salinarum AK4]
MADPTFSIGRLAQASGCKVPTIRYYEQVGLMPPPARTAGNQRVYTRHHAERLTFIRHARDLGFPLDDIRDLLGLTETPTASCAEADRIARRNLESVRHRIQRLKLLEAELERMTEHCECGTVDRCRVIEILSDHDKCLADDHPPAP